MYRQVFIWSNCLLDLGTDFLVGNMVFTSHTQFANNDRYFIFLITWELMMNSRRRKVLNDISSND